MIRIFVVIGALLLMAGQHARAAENEFTLSCDGTVETRSAKDQSMTREEVSKLGIVVNFAEHTVGFDQRVVPIVAARSKREPSHTRVENDVGNISFYGGGTNVTGYIDRVTGPRL